MIQGKTVKKYAPLFSLGICLLVLSGCFWAEQEHETPGLYMVNLLDKALYDDCHIPGSLNIAMTDVVESSKKWPKSAQIVFYCSNYSCEASTYCSKLLMKEGFEHVWDYAEGMAGWYQRHLKDPEGYPINGLGTQSYLTMRNEPLIEDESSSNVKIISTEDLKVLVEKHTPKDAK